MIVPRETWHAIDGPEDTRGPLPAERNGPEDTRGPSELERMSLGHRWPLRHEGPKGQSTPGHEFCLSCPTGVAVHRTDGDPPVLNHGSTPAPLPPLLASPLVGRKRGAGAAPRLTFPFRVGWLCATLPLGVAAAGLQGCAYATNATVFSCLRALAVQHLQPPAAANIEVPNGGGFVWENSISPRYLLNTFGRQPPSRAGPRPPPLARQASVQQQPAATPYAQPAAQHT